MTQRTVADPFIENRQFNKVSDRPTMLISRTARLIGWDDIPVRDPIVQLSIRDVEQFAHLV